MAAKGSLVKRATGGDRAALKKALANPGLRSKLPEHLLSPAQRAQRRMNTRLAQPIVSGSTTTERDLAHAAEAASGVKYGPLEAQQAKTLGEAQTYQRDIGNYYDEYQRRVAQNAANVQSVGAQAQQAVQGLQAGVTGLATQDLSALQQPANQAAAARGMGPAGDLSQMASNAAAVRQALVGGFAARQAATNAANTNYAGDLANVVAPGQKLQAVAQAGGKIREAREAQATTARERGAYGQQYREEARTAEAKNVLAQQIANVGAASKSADIKLRTSAQKETARANRARERDAATPTPSEQKTQAELDFFKKHGYYPPTGPPKTGKGSSGKGPDWVTKGEAGTGMTQLSQMLPYMKKAKAGEPFVPGHAKQTPMDRYAATQKVIEAMPQLKNPILARAVADALYDRHLSAYTVKNLIAAGYKPSQVASTLGVPTSQVFKKSHPKGSRPDTAGNPNVNASTR